MSSNAATSLRPPAKADELSAFDRTETRVLKMLPHGLGQRQGLSRGRARRAVRRRRQAAKARSRDRQPPHRCARGRARRKTLRPAHDGREAHQRRRAFFGAAEEMESAFLHAQGEISGVDLELTGDVRIGAPDGFSTYYLTGRCATSPSATRACGCN